MKGHFADAAGRRAYIDGLRELADFLDANPDVPAPWGVERFQLCAKGSDEEQEQTVHEVASAMDVTPERKGAGLIAARQFGPIEYFVIAIPKAGMDEHHAIQELGRRALEEQRAEAVAAR